MSAQGWQERQAALGAAQVSADIADDAVGDQYRGGEYREVRRGGGGGGGAVLRSLERPSTWRSKTEGPLPLCPVHRSLQAHKVPSCTPAPPQMRSCPPAASGAAPQPTWVAPLKRWQTRQAPPKRSKARQAALPPDALGALLPTAATAAAAASLLTALWLRGADGLGYGATAEAAADGGGDQQQDAAANTAPGEPPSSAGAIWAAAWQGFAPQQQPQAVREAQATASQLPDGHEGAAASQEGLQRSPVLLLEVGGGGGQCRPWAACCCLHQ